MSPELAASVCQAVILITEAQQDQERVHELLVALVAQGHTEGYLAGIAKAEKIINRHLGEILA